MMRAAVTIAPRPRFSLEPQDVAGAAIALQAFTLYLLALLALAPATEAEWSRADPILAILPRAPTLALVPLLGIAAAAFWVRRATPPRAVLLRSLGLVGAGALVAITIACAERAFVGPHLPSFVPPEESAGPGLLLSETAGYAEEVIFRLGVLALVFPALTRRLPNVPAALAAALVTGVAFALLHAAGSSEWSWPFFATRVIFPGMVMSLASLALRPSFVIGAHCAAHVVIPFLFV